jgi:hypothetical protein
MTTPARYNTDLWIGNHATFRWQFAVYTDDTETSTTSYPLTGVSVYFTIFNADTKLRSKYEAIIKLTYTSPSHEASSHIQRYRFFV